MKYWLYTLMLLASSDMAQAKSEYTGQAAAHGKQMAIHFALTDQTTKDYGTEQCTQQ